MNEKPVKVVVFRIWGELSLADVAELDRISRGMVRYGKVHQLLEFKAIGHVHYKVFETLIGSAMRLRRYGGDLKFCSMSQAHRDFLALCAPAGEFAMFENEEDALLEFAGRVYHQEPEGAVA